MNRRIATALLFLAVGSNLLACTSTDKIKEEKAIYPIVIQSVVSHYVQMRWLIADQTYADPIQSARLQYLQEIGVSQTTLKDYTLANQETYQLSTQFNFGLEFLSKTEEKEIFQGDYAKAWNNFHTKYSNHSGYITLSRAGFNPEMNQALVYAHDLCDSLCGSGNLYFLEKAGDTWYLKKYVELWIR
jgi:hypothetical protein